MIGGAEGIRTPGLVNASHALCQLSYSPSRIRTKWYEIDFDSVKKPSFGKPFLYSTVTVSLTKAEEILSFTLQAPVVPGLFFCYVEKL